MSFMRMIILMTVVRDKFYVDDHNDQSQGNHDNPKVGTWSTGKSSARTRSCCKVTLRKRSLCNHQRANHGVLYAIAMELYVLSPWSFYDHHGALFFMISSWSSLCYHHGALCAITMELFMLSSWSTLSLCLDISLGIEFVGNIFL